MSPTGNCLVDTQGKSIYITRLQALAEGEQLDNCDQCFFLGDLCNPSVSTGEPVFLEWDPKRPSTTL